MTPDLDPLCDISGVCSPPTYARGGICNCEYCGKELHLVLGDWVPWDWEDHTYEIDGQRYWNHRPMPRNEQTNRMEPGTRVRVRESVTAGVIQVAGKLGTVQNFNATIRMYNVRLDGMNQDMVFTGLELDEE